MADDYRATLNAAGLTGFGFTPIACVTPCGAPAVRRGTPKWVSEQLGHKDLTTTLRFYDEWVPKRARPSPTSWSHQILEFTDGAGSDDSRTRNPNQARRRAMDWDSELAELTGENSGAGGGS